MARAVKAPKKEAVKPKKQARGTGTVFWHETREVWIGRRIVGRKRNGDPHYVERSHRDQAEMLRRLALAEPPGPNSTVSSFADEWLKDMQCRPRTRSARVNSVEKHIKPVLGSVKVAALNSRQIEAATANWSAAGLEPGTVRLILSHLQTCLSEAVRADIRGDNPVQHARKPKLKRAAIDPFSRDELDQIMVEAARRPASRVLVLLAATGCRVGEALALLSHEFDPRGFVSINRTQDRSRKGGPTKSHLSQRRIRVTPAVLPALVAAVGGRTDGPLFATRTGGHTSYEHTRRAWVALLKRLKLRFRNLHQLRHSVATLMISNRGSLGDVAKYLGDTVETIVRTYLHASGADPCDVMDRLFPVAGSVSPLSVAA
jgi:integrase